MREILAVINIVRSKRDRTSKRQNSERNKTRLFLFVSLQAASMPDTCCAVGCKNRRDKCSLPFYRIPTVKKPERRRLWVAAIKRENWSEEQINKARICGAHFITGQWLLIGWWCGVVTLLPHIFVYINWEIAASLIPTSPSTCSHPTKSCWHFICLRVNISDEGMKVCMYYDKEGSHPSSHTFSQYLSEWFSLFFVTRSKLKVLSISAYMSATTTASNLLYPFLSRKASQGSWASWLCSINFFIWPLCWKWKSKNWKIWTVATT